MARNIIEQNKCKKILTWKQIAAKKNYMKRNSSIARRNKANLLIEGLLVVVLCAPVGGTGR